MANINTFIVFLSSGSQLTDCWSGSRDHKTQKDKKIHNFETFFLLIISLKENKNKFKGKISSNMVLPYVLSLVFFILWFYICHVESILEGCVFVSFKFLGFGYI